MILRTIIVDDEPLARERLKLLLADEPDVSIVQECRNGPEALEVLQTQSADLLFLDIQMPGMSGLDVVKHFGSQNLPATIFLTAYHEHAVQAFALAAVDYLTKPITRDRLREAIQRVRDRRAASTALTMQEQLSDLLSRLASSSPSVPEYLQHFIVRDGDKDLIVPARAVEWIEANDYYSSLHVGNRTHLLRESIAQLSKRLDPAVFVRVHRSAVVNIAHAKAIFREGKEEGTLLLVSGGHVKTSRAGRIRLEEVLSLSKQDCGSP